MLMEEGNGNQDIFSKGEWYFCDYGAEKLFPCSLAMALGYEPGHDTQQGEVKGLRRPHF